MSEKLKKLALEAGMWEDAKNARLTFTEFLRKLEVDAGFEPEGKLAESDAYERQLAAHGIRINDKATLVEHFFQTTDSRILFPEFIDRQIRLGLQLGRLDVRLEDTYAVSQTVSEPAVTPVGFDFSKEDVKPKRVAEGAVFPRMKAKLKDKTIRLKKVGRQLDMTYEVLRRMQVLQAGMLFQRLGFQMSREMTKEALLVIRDGDGNAGSAAGTSDAGGTWNYADLIDCLFQFKDGHEATHIVMKPDFLQEILADDTNFKQLQSINLLESFVKTGQIQNFFGLNWRTHPDMEDETILLYERDTCLKYYEEKGSSIQDTARIINQQIQETVISVNYGFSVMFDGAAHYKTKSA
ncbi:MAG: hypothetical protein HS115_11725 [Spirochaetales bacterium]|nr:hypothetical protein [Spirochaetales bacterium]